MTAKRVTSHLETLLANQILIAQLTPPEIEYQFHKPRRWRFDFAWPGIKLAVEVEGGTWANGRHTRGSGFAQDCEKYNTAALDGWTVLRFTGKMIEGGEALSIIDAAIVSYKGKDDQTTGD